RIDREAAAAFVGDRRGRLAENEAVVGPQRIDAAAEVVAREHRVIPGGVLTAQRKLEAAPAVEVAVAPAPGSVRARHPPPHRHAPWLTPPRNSTAITSTSKRTGSAAASAGSSATSAIEAIQRGINGSRRAGRQATILSPMNRVESSGYFRSRTTFAGTPAATTK